MPKFKKNDIIVKGDVIAKVLHTRLIMEWHVIEPLFPSGDLQILAWKNENEWELDHPKRTIKSIVALNNK